jgi:hypothetical protein
MKKFLTQIAYFIASVTVFVILSEALLHKFNIAHFDKVLSKSINNFEEFSDDLDALFLGDSRSFYGIDPNAINSKSNIHNFSFVSESIIITYWKMSYYLENKKLDNLKKVYIYFDESMISSPSRTRLKTTYDYSKFYNWNFDEITKDYSFTERINFWINVNSSLVRLRGSFRMLISQSLQSLVKKNNENELLEKSGLSTRLYSIKPERFESQKDYLVNGLKGLPLIHPEPIKYYHKLVKLLKKHNIEVVFYKIPSTSILLTYENNQLEQLYLNLHKREKYFIQSEFPGSKYEDFTFYDRWELEDFSDRGHLNKKGAQKLGRNIKMGL